MINKAAQIQIKARVHAKQVEINHRDEDQEASEVLRKETEIQTDLQPYETPAYASEHMLNRKRRDPFFAGRISGQSFFKTNQPQVIKQKQQEIIKSMARAKKGQNPAQRRVRNLKSNEL